MRQVYHPYRFGELAKTSSARFTRMEEMASEAAARRGGDFTVARREAFDRLMTHEAQGINFAEFAERMRDQAIVNAMRTKWVESGRKILDTSGMMETSEAVGALFSRPSLKFPAALYIHFGEGAALALSYYDGSFVDGMYIVSTESSDPRSYEFALVCVDGERAKKSNPTWGEILRSQSRATFGTFEPETKIVESMTRLSGDQAMYTDDVVIHCLERASLALSKAYDPKNSAQVKYDDSPRSGLRH